MGCDFDLSTHKPQKSEMHYDSKYVTVAGCAGDGPGLLPWESRAVTAGNSPSPGHCFPGKRGPGCRAAMILEGKRSRCAPPLTPRPALGRICTLHGGSDTPRRTVAFG